LEEALAKKGKGVAKKAPVKGGIKKDSKKKVKVAHSKLPIFEKRPRNYGIGGDIQPPRDMTRFVRWPKYIRLQRQKQVLMKRLKVPPAVNQFSHTLSSSDAKTLFTLLDKYRPETKQETKARLLKLAAEGGKPTVASPAVVRYGLNEVTKLVERKKAKLVIIPHDLQPLELVLWLPTLCRKKGIPYVIVKGKGRTGAVVHQKTAAALAIVEVEQKDQATLNLLIEKANNDFIGRYPTTMKTYGGKILGSKNRAALAKAEKKRKVNK
jgi:large subunit ribosomal protein L7Ae